MVRGSGTGNDDRAGAGPDRGRDGTGEVDRALHDLLADARLDEGVAERRRRHWLRAQAAAGARFDGVCRALAHLDAVVILATTDGATHRGRVRSVGLDHVELASPEGRTLLPLAALAWVVPAQPVAALGVDDAGDPDETVETRQGADLRTVLATWADEQPLVALNAGRTTLEGTLRWVGVDVLAVELTRPGAPLAYVRLSSLAAASLRVSG